MTVELRLHGDAGTETLEFDAAAADRLVRPTSLELLRTVAREEPSRDRKSVV